MALCERLQDHRGDDEQEHALVHAGDQQGSANGCLRLVVLGARGLDQISDSLGLWAEDAVTAFEARRSAAASAGCGVSTGASKRDPADGLQRARRGE